MKEFIKKHRFLIILFLTSFILRLIYILIVKTPIISDFRTMYDASKELLNHTNKYYNSQYFTMWGYQMGHTYYQYLLLKIVNSVVFLKIVNCLCTSLIVVFIYLIARKKVSEKSARIASIIYMLFPFPLFLNSVLTNQHLPLLLILIGIYLFLNIDFKNINIKSIFKMIVIGILFGFSNIMRSELVVILFSILLFFIILIKKIKFKNSIFCFALIIISYLLVTTSTSFIFKKTNLSKNGLSNMNTYWKFVCGLNYKTNGMYSDEDARIYSADKKLAKEETINRIKNYKKLPLLFAKKSKILLLNSDLSWSIGHINNQRTYNILNAINKIFIVTLVILSIISVKYIFKMDYTYLLCAIILLVYIGVYMLIEVMPRYAYSLQPFMTILSAYGIEQIFSILNHKKL